MSMPLRPIRFDFVLITRCRAFLNFLKEEHIYEPSLLSNCVWLTIFQKCYAKNKHNAEIRNSLRFARRDTVRACLEPHAP